MAGTCGVTEGYGVIAASRLWGTGLLGAMSLAAGLLVIGTASAEEPGHDVDFDRDIRPILSDACFTCHGPDSNRRVTDLRFDLESSLFEERDEPVIVRGDPESSALIRRVTSGDAEIRMPPPDAARQLSDQEVNLLTVWIRQGAQYTRHWAFERPQRPELPAVSDPEWPRNAIDYFVLAGMDEQELKPTAAASRETLIRRLSLDLTGLPPTPAEVDAFLADSSADAYDTVVNRLLASVRFGEHFAATWLDAARYADSNGYQRDATRTMWPWRDWVVRAFNQNLPFDQFTVDQIAGDLLPQPSTDQLVATGFQRNHMLNGEGGRIAEESRVEYVIDRVETLGTTWLGLTVGCARCHDHKYDTLAQREFYQLYAYFNSVDESGRVDAGGNAKPVLPVPTREQQTQREALARKLADIDRRLKTLATESRQREWEAETLRRFESGTVPSDWRMLKVTEFDSAHGQKLSRQSDGSLLLTGPNPVNDSYRLEMRTDLRTVTAIRVEAVPHPEFTRGGFARSDSGNFVLTELAVSVRPRPDSTPERVSVSTARASFEQGGWPVRNALDGRPETGWAVNHPSDMTIPRYAMFVFSEPIVVDEQATLVVDLKHESPHRHHNLGRFRLSATSRTDPQLEETTGLPPAAVAALQTPAEERTAAQQKLVQAQFQQRDADLVALAAEREKIRKRQSDLEKSVVQTMVMRDLPAPRDTFVLIRGIWNQPDRKQPVQPGTPSVLPPLPGDSPANRLGLARWLVSSENPLTARVIVNRFWQQIFGQGLVRTPEDFGVQGQRPDYPELLDWLAVEFVESGWDVKHLLRTIVQSAVYRQASTVSASRASVDPTNRWMSRAPRYRLSSLVLRDQALALSGLLVERQGGPPVKPYQPPGIWADLSLGKIQYRQDSGPKLYRRSLYTFWRRASAPASFFDTASRQVCQVRVSRTNTPLHALVVLNDVTYVEAARKMAERVLRESRDGDSSRLAYAFRLATARRPDSGEAADLNATLVAGRQYFDGRPAAVESLLSAGESSVDVKVDPQELAAWAVVCNVILNLDETLTRE